MPRIDPHQLLSCLNVLLSPNGGIKSKDVVNRLASLMTKFSKKLVSKCIYILILKATDVDLLDMFMSSGGWDLTYSWLNDGIQAKNWALVGELVELLLLCPVDIERLKGNNCPKLIKLLSKDTTATTSVREFACKVVEKWLAIVKGACESTPTSQSNTEEEPMEQEEVENGIVEEDTNVVEAQIPVYKITIRDGKQVLAEVISERGTSRVDSTPIQEVMQQTQLHPTKMEESPKEESEEDEVIKPMGKKRALQSMKKELPKKKTIKRPSPDPEFKPEKKSREKRIKQIEPLPETYKKKEKEKERIKTKEKIKQRDEVQNEKDRATLAKLVGPPINNLGKIPKKIHKEDQGKGDEKKGEEKKTERKPVEAPKPPPKDPKKYNISVEPRKRDPSTERPKTVKTYNSKFRSTGLEEAPPPPKCKKNGEEEKRSPKRSSPTKDMVSPVPEKKLKMEKTGTTPPQQPSKPKTNFLQESDVFADALTAANPVKDVKKKKRRVSLSEKDKKEVQQGKSEDKKTPETIKPTLKFYQETLMTSEDKGTEEGENSDRKEDVKVKNEIKEEDLEITDDLINMNDGPSSPAMTREELEDEVAKAEEAITQVLKQEEKRNVEREKNRLPRGILAYIKKKKSIKKSVQWRSEAELEDIKYFELDETERVNVTKPFGDMKQMERISERENILLSRKNAADDVMEEKTSWRPLLKVDFIGEQIIPGKNSIEKEIQFARERTTLQAIYFNKRMIPDSPGEPDLEIHATTEPAVIPLDDQTGNSESVLTYRQESWPEPKGYAPGAVGGGSIIVGGHQGAMQPSNSGFMEGGGSPLPGPQQPPNFLPPPSNTVMPGFFPPNPGFPGQGMPPPNPMPTPQPMPPDWGMGGVDGNMMGPEMMMGPPGLLGAGPEMYGMVPPPPDFMGPPPPHFIGPPMFPFHPQGPPDMRGPRPPWFRQNGPTNPGTWRHPSKGGGGNWNKTRGVCNNYMKKGGCRTKQCPYRHPPPPR